MREFEANWGRAVLKYRWLVIFVTLLLVFSAASGGRFLSFTTNYRVFFSSDNPQLQAFEALENTYTRMDNVMFVLTPKNGDVFTRETLSVVESLTKEAWKIPYSIRVDSLANFQHTEASADELVVQDLVENASEYTDEQLEKIRTVALNEPLLVNRLVSPKAHVTAVNATIQLPGKNEAKEVPAVVSYSRELADQIRAAHPGLEVRITGMVMMNNAFAEASKKDMKSLVLISFGLMIVVLAILLRSVSATFGTLLTILFSIMVAMGIAGHIGVPITPPSATSPTIILTVAIANSVHVLVSFLHEMRAGSEKRDALVESLRINLQPVFLASLTTAIGFLTMNFSEVPPFQHLGNIVATGVAASFFLAVIFLPALMSLLPIRVKVQENVQDSMMVKFGEFVVSQRRVLLWGMVTTVIILVSFLPRNELNDVFVNYFDKSVQFRVDSDYMTENLTGLYVADYSLVSGEPGGISEPGFLKEVKAFADWYRKQPETMHVNVITDVMIRLNMNMHGDKAEWFKLPEERNLSAQYLLLYEMSLPYGLDLNNQINVDKSATRMTVSLQTMSSNEMLAIERRASDWIKANARFIKQADGSGPSLMFAHIGKRNIKSMLLGTTIALLLISAILILALRSMKIGLVSILPNLIPAAMGFGLWGMLVGEVGLALSVVSSMTLGIVVDDTVHFLTKYLRARRERGLSSPEAVKYAFATVGRALVTTSIVLVVGFLVLSQSSFELNAGMGLLTAIVIFFALAADFLLLPPLLMKLEEGDDEKGSAPGAAESSVTA